MAIIKKEDLGNTVAELKTAAKAFNAGKDAVSVHIAKLEAIQKIETKEARNEARTLVGAAKKELKNYLALGLDLRKPLNRLGKSIIAVEKENSIPLKSLIAEKTAAITAFDIEVERKRQAEAARIEAEAEKERQKVRAEQKRVDDLAQEITVFRSELTEIYRSLQNCTASEFKAVSNRVKATLNDARVHTSIFQERTDEVVQMLDNCKNAVNTLIEAKQEQVKIELEAAKLEAENKAQAAELRRLEAKAAKAKADAEAEKVRLQQELEEAEAEKVRIEAERKKRAAAVLKQQELEAEASKIEAEKLKGIKSGFSVEVVDIDLVPDQFIKKTLKLKEVNKFVKLGNTEIKGLKITTKNGLTFSTK